MMAQWYHSGSTMTPKCADLDKSPNQRCPLAYLLPDINHWLTELSKDLEIELTVDPSCCCVLCILTSFFSRFSTFFVRFKAFSVISRLKSLKNVWKWTKKCGFVYSSKLVNVQKLVDSLRGYLKIVFFQWIFSFFLHFSAFFDWFRCFFVDL